MSKTNQNYTKNQDQNTNHNIYFDNYRLTPLLPEVVAKLNTIQNHRIALPAAPYISALNTQEQVEEVRDNITKSLGVDSSTIYFTGGFDDFWVNFLDQFIFRKINNKTKPKIVISQAGLSHQMMPLETLAALGKIELMKVTVDNLGRWELPSLKKLVQGADLVLIDHTSHVLGTIQAITKIVKTIRTETNSALILLDTTYSYTRTKIQIAEWGIDGLFASGHTIGAGWGISFMYLKKPLSLPIFGLDDRQNILGILALGIAVKKYLDHPDHILHIQQIRNYLYQEIIDNITNVKLNGTQLLLSDTKLDEYRSPDSVNLTFDYIEGEALALKLAFAGFEVTTGSACSHKALMADYALLAIGRRHEDSHGSLRFSFSWLNTLKQVDKLMAVLPDIITELRAISAFRPETGYDYEKIKKES